MRRAPRAGTPESEGRSRGAGRARRREASARARGEGGGGGGVDGGRAREGGARRLRSRRPSVTVTLV